MRRYRLVWKKADGERDYSQWYDDWQIVEDMRLEACAMFPEIQHWIESKVL